ncbi:MAG: CinA family protein [Vampirovibrionales bacterium]
MNHTSPFYTSDDFSHELLLLEVITRLQTLLAMQSLNKERTEVPYLAVAESCTGGLLSHWFTTQAGSSQWFKGGMVVYHNHLKTTWLGVKKNILVQEGAVSEACSHAMAEGLQQKSQASIVLTTTGIASPNVHASEKPEGTLFISSKIMPPDLVLTPPPLNTPPFTMPPILSVKRYWIEPPYSASTETVRATHQRAFAYQALLHLQEHLHQWLDVIHLLTEHRT